MKVKNIVFSGFAAAILMGTAHAADPVFQIASKAYVDRLTNENGAITTLSNKIGNDAMGTTATTVTGAIGELDTKVDTLTGSAQTSGSVAHAEASAAAAQSDVNTLAANVGSGFTSTNTVAAALDTKLDKSSTSATLPAVTNASASNYANELAVAQAIAAVNGGVENVSSQIETALGGTYGGENATVTQVLATKANASDIAGANEELASDIAATTIVGAINELNSEKQDKTSSTATAGTYVTAGNGVGANLNALDTNLSSVAGRVTTAEGKITTAEGKISTLEGTVGNSESGLVADVAALQTAMGSSTAAGLAADIATNAGDIDALETKIGNDAMGTTATTVTGAIGELDGYMDTLRGASNVSGSVAEAKKAGDDAQSDVDALETIVGSGFNTTNTVAAAISAKANASDVYTKSELDTMIGAKLNHPATNACTAESQHCVLHMDNTGALSWIDITVPYAE